MNSPHWSPRWPKYVILLGTLASIAPLASANVLIDSYRGQAYLPSPLITPNYNNNVAPGNATDRYDGVQRLLAFAATPGNRATPVAGTSLITSWPDLNIPSGSGVMCESAGGTNDACQNRIQGAVMYTALLMPAQGNYTLQCSTNSDDGTIVDLAPTQGTDYRNLGYSQGIVSFCLADVPYGANGVLTSPAPNTLVNLRLAWNNWGNAADNIIYWTPPGGGSPEPIPADKLYDPSDPATYLTAANDNFSATPLLAGAGGSTAPVFSNDRVNVATPVSAGAGGTAANIQTWALVSDPVTSAPPPAGFSLNQDGTLSVAASIAPGTYSVSYEICRTDTRPQPLCATATATVRVASPTPVPSLSHWGLVLLGLLAAALGMRQMRRGG